MGAPRLDERTAGLLLHPTSLPGPHGTGDLGREAYRFADFLAAAGLRWWQMLPVHPPGAANSPYDAQSAFAGSPWLIGLDLLAEAGWLDAEALAAPPEWRKGPARFAASRRFREVRLRRAFARFERAGGPLRREVERFHDRHGSWLDDYVTFQALKRVHGTGPWMRWPRELRRREPAALGEVRRELAAEIRYHTFLQFVFDRQWRALQRYCHERGIGLMGDVPLFVSHDCADVWAHPELFHMDRQGRLPVVAGVPPDAFNDQGQRWGNPLFRWDVHAATGFAWWSERLRLALERFDAIRLDHFIGFTRYWEVPGSAKTARAGRFRPGPGAALFEQLRERLGPLPLIAEDLGIVTPEVTALRERLGFPGMVVLQFAFGGDPRENPYLPHHHQRHSVVYTGTHDNDTLVGWFRESSRAARSPADRRPEIRAARRYVVPERGGMHWAFIRLAWSSVANLAIIPAQDLLGLGSEARMNRPGLARGNWSWRLAPRALTRALATRVGRLSVIYGRAAPCSRADMGTS
ncbi:MAG: 4-alpha-glucanotransferase [Candidatus Lambdaproteobacteria bacterium]|nr:4-alpha-glucanotransferase [Candidatus Lambdaproteobacteria bacterium]